MLTLVAKKREKTGTRVVRLISSLELPGVVYGPKEKAIPISFSLSEFLKVLKKAGESSVIELTGLSKPLQVLIHEIDRDPITDSPRHVDFYAIEKGAKVEVAVPLVFVGESPAAKEGANIVKVLHELEIEADPTNLPHNIVVDMSVLQHVGDQILVSDLSIPLGVTVREGADQVVALVQEVKIEKEEEAPSAPDMASIEVEKKGKEEEPAEPQNV